MYGELFRKWLLFLKKRKLYSNFISCYEAANMSAKSWTSYKPSFRIVNGCDRILPNKSNTLGFDSFMCGMRTIDWYLYSIFPTTNWTALGYEFGELNGYLPKRNINGGLYTMMDEDEVFSCKSISTSYRTRNKHQEREDNIKWYDRYYRNFLKTRYRR
jgi:hypothetical protein